MQHSGLITLLLAPQDGVTHGGGVEVVKGDVFQFSSLPKAFGDSNALIICTGATERADPLGPFNVDYQVCGAKFPLRMRVCASGRVHRVIMHEM